jgi:hypothetical protein
MADFQLILGPRVYTSIPGADGCDMAVECLNPQFAF